MNIIEEINLPNGLKLTVADFTRRIASDTKKVELTFSMKIDVLESFFASEEDYRTLVNVFGPELTYEHKLERTFVSDQDEEEVRTELLNTFKSNTLQYLALPNFAQKMALSTLRDMKRNPFKYRPKNLPPETEE
jgi:hypothetical protein